MKNSTTPNKKIVFIAGETSGDMRAAGIIRSLKILSPNLSITGIGGPSMRSVGVNTFADINDLSFVGVTDVVRNLSQITKIFNSTLDHIRTVKPDVVVLVDYPGFNLRLAKKLKTLGIKVIYYIAPKVWAWNEGRVNTIRAVIDRLLVIFPFEIEYFKKHQINVDYVGNPLMDEINISEPPTSVKAYLKFDQASQTIGLLPGSRSKEIERHMPIMIATAKELLATQSNRQFLLIKAPSIAKETLEKYIKHTGLNYRIYEGSFYNAVGACDALIVASGTATLEVGLLLKPMAVMYTVSPLTFILGKIFVKIPYLSLVNIISRREIVKEFIQYDATPKKISTYINNLLSNPNAYAPMTNDLAQMKKILGKGGASQNAARIILEEIK